MDKRISKRIPFTLEGDLVFRGTLYKVLIGNISANGLHVIAAPGIKDVDNSDHTPVELKLQVSPGQFLNLHCFIISSDNGAAHSTTKMCLEIPDPPAEFKKFYKDTYYKVRNETSHDAIAVIGMACYYPGAPNLKAFWENILARRREFRRFPDQRLPLSEYFDADPLAPDKTYGNRAAVIDGFEFDWIKRGIPKTVVESSDIVHWLALEIAIQALEDAGYIRNNMPCDRTGVILGNTLTGEHSRSQNMRLRWPYVKKVLKAAATKKKLSPSMIAGLIETMEVYYKAAFAPITEDTLAGNLSNTIAGRICNFLDLRGGGYTVDGACSSSLIAVLTAASALSSGTLDVAVVGGIDISLDTFELIGFAKTNALTRGDMQVYDRRASGFIPGEGTGFVILKRLENARAHGNYIYAVLDGWGMSSDGKGGMTAPKAKTQALAIQRAYGKAGYGLRDVDFIEGHGTGTKAGDKAELEGIALAMGDEHSDFLRSCGITSLKSLIGHTKAASGIGGFIKAVMAVNRRVIPPTAGCKEPNPVFQENAHRVYPILQGEIRSADDSIRAGISSMGFGGINCHVTIESAGNPAKHLEPSIGERELLASHQETELFVLSAESQEKMIDRIQYVKNLVEGISSGELLDLSRFLSEDVSPNKPFRVALITASPEDLIDCLERVEQMLSTNQLSKGETMSSPQQDIWVGNSVLHNRVGFLFPGQGSQQLNMGRRMIERYSWARDFRDKVESWLSETHNRKISGSIYRPLDRALNTDQIDGWKKVLSRAEVVQPAICLTSLLWMRYLENLGITPVVVGGHSLGELTAFCAAGVFDDKALLSFAAMRGRATSASDGNPGMMASFACGKKRVEELLKEIEGYVVVANINSPTQTVISGERPAVEKAMKLGSTLGIETKRLPVSNAFHSRFMIDAADIMLKYSPIPETLIGTKIKLLTCMDGTEVTSQTNLRGHFAKQVTNQTDFISLVDSITQECDLLLEVGPGRVLSNLVEAISGTDGIVCFPVESSAGDDRSLNVFLGCYFVRGGDISWKVLFENRLVRPFIPASKRMFIDNPCERPFVFFDEEISGSVFTNDTLPTVVSSTVLDDADGLFTRQQIDFIRRLIHAESQKSTDIPKSYPERPIKEIPTIVSQFDNATVKVSNGSGGKEKQETSEQVEKIAVSIPDLLLDLIEKRTGFPRESLSMEVRLLNDLNLDSIKAAELIAAASMHLGLAGELDAAKFANATLSELADTLARLTKEKTGVERLFNEKVGSLIPSHARNTWVRDFVVHYVHEPLPSTVETYQDTPWETSCVLIISDESESAIATALQSELKGKGAQVQVVFFSEAPLELEKGIVFTHYVTILPRTPTYGLSPAARLLAIVERLRTAVTLESSVKTLTSNTTLAYVQFGGGYFGTEVNHGDIEQCCAAAFAASVHLESPHLKMRVVDFSPLINEAVVAQYLMRELSTPEHYSAIGYDLEMVRRVPRPRIQEPSFLVQRSITWSSDDVILVTGGAKGVTAECAHAFARVTGVRMVLVGSSPLPDNKPVSSSSSAITRILERFSAEGLSCRYYSCDITDSNALNLLIQRIRHEIGPITGVIHGAGLNRPNRTENVSSEEALKEIGPKLYGAMNLCNVLKDAPPKLFVGFTSIIGVTGMPGNAWYAFSNEALNVVLSKFEMENPTSSVLCIAFSIWEEVGMGARLGSVHRLAKMGIGAIPTMEGVHRFLSLLLNNTEARQVIVTARLGGLDTWTPEHLAPPSSRFLENIVIIEPNVEVVSRTHLSLQQHTYLKDHLWRGTYLFPTVFGLEAMSQAVSYVTGQNNFNTLVIEDIRLDRPIAVSSEAGCTIEIHAEVFERESAAAPLRVSVGIRCDQTGFSTDHFAATFILVNEMQAPLEHIDIPETPLNIEPKRDIYGRLLWQGPLFQRIQQIYSLNSAKCVFLSEFHPDPNASGEYKASSWLMGDPFFRDSLMQAIQLPLSRDICLPLKIERLERYEAHALQPESLVGVAIIKDHRDREVTATVYIVDENGYVVERLTRCVLKVIEHHDDYPTAEELADPGKRDANIIYSEIGKRACQLDLIAPEISSVHIPDIHQLTKTDRHKQELPLLQETVGRALKRSGYMTEAVRIAWLEPGKPNLEDATYRGLDISLSHDEGTVFCVAGLGPQGCDIASVTNRTSEEWIALLGKATEPLFQQLTGSIDTHDRAGTRIWAAIESVRKATTSFVADLAIEKQEGDTILFRSDLADKRLHILTLPMALTRGPERMIALVVQPARDQHSVIVNEDKKTQGEKLNFDFDSHKADIIDGPQGQPLLLFHFPVTFKEASNPSRTLYFSHYFAWIGKLREYVIQPIYENLVESFSTGKWGMVTNHAETSIVGDAQSGDKIEGRVWFDKVSGKEQSKIDMCFEWWKNTSEGKREQIGFSTMSTTWVAIRGHGLVEVQPLPAFAKEFLNKWLPPLETQEVHHEFPKPVPPFDFGRELYREPAGPIQPAALITERTFETTLEDANLVGNIYFSNYYLWQGRVRDHFINEIASEYFSGSGKQGELRCIRCKVNHLNEAMPFERIGVSMYRTAIYKRGVKLYFDYYRVGPNGDRKKLGHGEHEAIWFSPTEENKWVPSELPRIIRDALLPKKDPENLNVSPVPGARRNEEYDVIVVGSGIGGLSAAALLAKQGKHVLVIEQHDKPGGFCTSWERHVKHNNENLRFVFEAGVHDIAAFGDYSHIFKLLRSLEVADQIEWRRVDHEYILPNFRLKVPRELNDYVNLLCKQFPAEKVSLSAFFHEVEVCFEELYALDRLRAERKNLKIDKWRNVSLMAMLDTYFKDDDLKKVLLILSNYFTDDPSSLSVITAIPYFGYYIKGGCYPVGGSQVLSDTLARVIDQRGGKVRLHALVSNVLVERGHVTGVKLTNDEVIDADIVISNADLRRTFLELVGQDHLQPHFRQRIEKLRPSNSAFMVSLGIDFVPEIQPATFWADEKEPLIIMVPSKIDFSLAPPGCACIALIKLLRHEEAVTWNRSEPDYHKRGRQYGDELINRAEKVLPKLSEHILYRQDASPATFERYARTTSGAIYGLAIDEWRPSIKTPIQGLYLVGAGASTQPGVENAGYSGIMVASIILRNERNIIKIEESYIKNKG